MIKRTLWLIVMVSLSGLVSACGLGGDVAMPAVFSDHAVFQRNRPIPVWGTAEPGRRVVVRFAGQKKGAVAGVDGRWMLQLDPVPAGGPYNLFASTGLKFIWRKDILVGDVWVCSGQSNMAWPLAGANNAEEEIADANWPGIRLFTVPRKLSESPEADVDGRWVACLPETAADFSAVAFFFGRSLHKALHVPVGLINTSWGGTRVEPWTPRRSVAFDPAFAEMLAEYDRRAAREVTREKAAEIAAYEKALERYERDWPRFLEDLDQLDRGAGGQWRAPDLATGDWKTMKLPAHWERGDLGAFDGVVWFRKEVSLPEDWAGKDLLLELGPVDDDDVTCFNGKKIGAVGYDRPGHWRVNRRYTVPGRLAKPGRNVIAVRVLDGGGNGGIWGKPEQMRLAPKGGPKSAGIALAGAWKYKVGYGGPGEKVPSRPREPRRGRYIGQIYNAMVAPLVPYAISGAIWYQGESNAGQPVAYRSLFPAMIQAWRHAWHEGDFPFLFVQLANFTAAATQPDEGGWAWVREAQAAALKLPATGMAVTLDIGDANDIHPGNKQEVGRRLALAAIKAAHGKNIVYSGPVYKSMAVEGGKVRVRFAHVGGGLVARGGPLKQFAIAGQDRVFHWAEAKIDPKQPGTVLVWSDKVAKPVAVRYAWASNPAGCNLYNKEGLPAAPFRTDDWDRPVRVALARRP